MGCGCAKAKTNQSTKNSNEEKSSPKFEIKPSQKLKLDEVQQGDKYILKEPLQIEIDIPDNLLIEQCALKMGKSLDTNCLSTQINSLRINDVVIPKRLRHSVNESYLKKRRRFMELMGVQLKELDDLYCIPAPRLKNIESSLIAVRRTLYMQAIIKNQSLLMPSEALIQSTGKTDKQTLTNTLAQRVSITSLQLGENKLQKLKDENKKDFKNLKYTATNIPLENMNVRSLFNQNNKSVQV